MANNTQALILIWNKNPFPQLRIPPPFSQLRKIPHDILRSFFILLINKSTEIKKATVETMNDSKMLLPLVSMDNPTNKSKVTHFIF
jgi:hypothetical protein